MAKKIAYINQDGNAAVIHTVVQLGLQEIIDISVPVELTKDGVVSKGVSDPFKVTAGSQLDPRIAAMNGLKYKQVPYILLDDSDLPVDRLFRGAWKIEDGSLVECVDAAKEVLHDLRRIKREWEFTPLDKEINIYIADQEKVAELEARRQKVRDKYASLQEEIDACIDPEELRTKIKEASLSS